MAKFPSIKPFLAKATIIVVLLTPPVAFLHYFLPRSAIVEMGQPSVKRMDNDGNLVGQTDNPHGATRDVFFVNTYDPSSGSPFVLRNEDTGWGFPWYFRFDSADLNAKASKLDKKIVKIRYYGFRIEILSLFPNVLSIEPAEIGDSTFPWARVVFGTLFVGVFGYLTFLLRNVLDKLAIVFTVVGFAFRLIGKLYGLLRGKKSENP